MSDPSSLQRMEVVDEGLLQLEQRIGAATPELLRDFPDILEEIADSLSRVIKELRNARDLSDPRMKTCAQRLKQRASRLKVLLQYGENFCATRLSNLSVFCGGYTADGVPRLELRGTQRGEA